MNYTQNHHLPQWVESDRIQMSDFNQMNQNIESGLNAAAQAASAAYSPDNLPYVIGSYTGSSASQTIKLGFMPSFLIVTGMKTSFDANDNTPAVNYLAIVGSNGTIVNGQLQYRLQLVGNGFSVFQAGNHDSQLPILNELGRTYYYIAFK